MIALIPAEMLAVPALARTLALSLTVALSAATAGAADALSPFPSAAAGQQRYVITLEPRADEPLQQVELLIGKTLEVDCNLHKFMGTLRRETISGWGYTYYTVEEIHGPAGTMMACPKDSKKDAFVTLGGEPHWVRYNSKLPVVVYVPEGFQVRYRIWSAAEPAMRAQRR